MSVVKVTFTYEPDAESEDPIHQMGISDREFMRLHDTLQDNFEGADNIEVERTTKL